MQTTRITFVLQRLIACTALCALAAAPSLVWASKEFDLDGMLCGVGVFIMLYTTVSVSNGFPRLAKKPFVARTLYIGYIVRMLVSVIYPLGLGLDLIPGLISIELVKSCLGPGHDFVPTFAITLVQGTLLNIILLVFMLLVYGVQRVCLNRPPPPGYCVKCGYDLRASPIRCPECGEPTPPPAMARPVAGHLPFSSMN